MKWRTVALCFCAVVTVAACGKAEEMEDDQFGKHPTQTTTYKRLARIVHAEGTEHWADGVLVSDNEYERSVEWEFEWQGDVVKGIKWSNGNYAMAFDYEGGRPTAAWSVKSQDKKNPITYNGKGMIESMVDGGTGNEDRFYYNEDGNLLKVVSTDNTGDHGPTTDGRAYTWHNGNMASKVRFHADGQPDELTEETFEYDGKITPWAGIPQAVAVLWLYATEEEQQLSKNNPVKEKHMYLYDGDYLVGHKRYVYSSEDGTVKEYETTYYEYTDGTGRTE